MIASEICATECTSRLVYLWDITNDEDERKKKNLSIYPCQYELQRGRSRNFKKLLHMSEATEASIEDAIRRESFRSIVALEPGVWLLLARDLATIFLLCFTL